MPVELVEMDSAQLGVDISTFAFGDVWDLSPTLSPDITTVGASSKRRFPAVRASGRLPRPQ